MRLAVLIAGSGVVLGFGASTLLAAVVPGWERIWLVVAFLLSFLATRPLRQLLVWLGALTIRHAGIVPPVVAAVVVARVVAPELFDPHWNWIWLGAGILVGLVFTRPIVVGLAWLSVSPLLHRLAAFLSLWLGALVAARLWLVAKPEFALSTPWLFGFVPLLLLGILVADVAGFRLQDIVFQRVPWEAAFLGGGAAVALVFFVIAPKLEEEDERLERWPILPVSNGAVAYIRLVDGRAEIVVDGDEPRGVDVRSVRADSSLSWSPDGRRLAYVRGHAAASHLWALDAATRTSTRLTRVPGDYRDPAWSPDGSRIAFTLRINGNADVYTMSASSQAARPDRLTTHRGADVDPTWSPDGDEIAFASERTGQFDIYRMAADGSWVSRLTRGTQFSAKDGQPAWSPHGRAIAFVSRIAAGRKADIYVVDADGRGRLKNLTSSATTDSTEPVWSPDGEEIAFTRVAGGKRAVYRIPVEELRKRRPGNADPLEGAPQPAFSPAWKPLPEPHMTRHAYRDPVRAYAPLVRLYELEEYWPMSASTFISTSALDWVGCDKKRIAERPVETRLGGGERPGDTADAYRIERGECAERRRALSVHDRTRPRDRDEEGFVLTPRIAEPKGPRPVPREPGSPDPDNRRRFVDTKVVPVYYEHVPRRSITYWMFYGFSATNPAGEAGRHQGDWERITVCLDRTGRAASVVYHKHHSNRPRRWSLVPKFGTHPLVYSAEGSHASYSSPGTNAVLETFDRRDEGAVWPTWERLVSVLAQPWYGYGGSWGSPPGPDGPSRFKVGDEGC